MTCIRFRPRLLRREHLQLLVEAMDTVQDRLDDASVLTAAGRFFATDFRDGDELGKWLQDRDAHSQFFPWLLWDAGPREQRLGARVVVGGGPMGPARAELLDVLLDSPADVFQVVRSTDSCTTVERVRDSQLIALEEPVLHAVVGVGELLVARVLDLGDCHLLDAVHACLPITGRRGMVRAARKAAQLPSEQRLPLLMAAGQRAMARAWRHESRLKDPDGAPIMRVTTRFAIEDETAVARALEHTATEGLLRRRARGVWVVSNPSLGHVGATLRLRAGRLMTSTSSVPRADTLAGRLERQLPGLRREMTVLRDLDGVLGEEGHGHAEVRRLAQDWVEEYLAGFEDTPHKSLGGITPREAMRTSRGRSKVRDMLQSVQRFGDAAGADTPGVDHIWSKLGLR